MLILISSWNGPSGGGLPPLSTPASSTTASASGYRTDDGMADNIFHISVEKRPQGAGMMGSGGITGCTCLPCWVCERICMGGLGVASSIATLSA